MDDDVLGLHDGTNNAGSEQLNPEQSEPQLIFATKGGSNRSPQLVTVQCSLEITQPQSGPPSVIGVRGYLDWGINSCSHKAEFDWIQGCAFTITATSFKLRAKLRNSITPGTYVLAKGSAAYGSKSAVSLQLSTDYVNLPSLVATTFVIPPWATHGLVVAIPGRVLLNREVSVAVQTYTNVTRYEVLPGDCTEANRFPLSADVQKVKVTNLSEDTAIDAAVIWRLSL